MSDRELLQLAAKAHGGVKTQAGMLYVDSHQQGWLRAWDPLRDDGDALRLAVKLRMAIDTGCFSDESFAAKADLEGDADAVAHNGDPYAAARRAIVRAAAEIGRAMK